MPQACFAARFRSPASGLRRLAAAVILVSVLLPAGALAVPRTWENTGTAFGTGGNWIGGTAPANNLNDDIGVFANPVVTNNPQLTGNRSINGLLFNSGTAGWTFTGGGAGTGTRIFSIGSSGIVNDSANAQTFSATRLSLAVGANQTWNAAAGAFSIASAVDLNTFALTLGGNAATNSTISGVISDSGQIIKSGTGTWTLTGANTYTGATTINQGTLQIGADNNLGTGSITVDGGALRTTNTMTITASRSLSFGAAGGTLDVATGTTLTYDGALAGTGALTKAGTGTFVTGGTDFNSWTGPLAVNAGTFEITKQGFVGAIDNAAAVTVAGGATLRFNGNAAYTQETIGSLSGGGTVVNSGAAAVNFIISGASNTTFSGVITDTTNNLNLLKTGTSTLTLSGSNSYDGVTTISNGVIIAANNTALGTASNGTTVVSGAGLALQGGITVTNETLSVAGTGVGANGALRNLSGTNT